MSTFDPVTLAASFRAELLQNILPYWHRLKTSDGLLPALDNDNQPLPSPLGLVMVARLLWTYSRAYREFGDAGCLELARHAKRTLVELFADEIHGGFYWSVDAETRAPIEPNKQCYGQAFCVYALAEHHAAERDADSLARARSLYNLLEAKAWEPRTGGYLETFHPDWTPLAQMRLGADDLDAPKTMNNHLHMIEAYANLQRVAPDPAVKASCRRLLRVLADRILLPDAPRFGLYYDMDWRLLDPVVSPGHDIEGSWLLWEAAEIVGDADLKSEFKQRSIQMAALALETGVDQDGSIFDEFHLENPRSETKCWWPQAEGVVGFYNAYQLTGDDRYLAASQRVWTFIQERIIDRQKGEWIWGLRADGSRLEKEKAGPWKSAYHNGRACMEMIARLAQPVAGRKPVPT